MPKAQVKATPCPEGGFRHTDKATIPKAALTDREKKVLGQFSAKGHDITVKELARVCFPGMRSKPGRYEDEDGNRRPMEAAYRCVLNQLRRLVAGGYVVKTAKGTYAKVVKA